jgi:hypothetical protein
LRWFASFVLSIGMVVCFYEYEKVKILDTYAKRWFNTVSTGLYLTVSIRSPPLRPNLRLNGMTNDRYSSVLTSLLHLKEWPSSYAGSSLLAKPTT